jgi:hypothetical protein
MSKDLKYTTWSSVFIAYINLIRKGLPLTRGLSSGHHVQEAIEVLQTAFG